MKHKLVTILFAITLLITGNSINAQVKEELGQSPQSANRIVGAWETTVTPRNCQTGEQSEPSFRGVLTFNEGGTVAEYGANPATPYRTPGHGIWTSTGGGNTYLMRFSFIPPTPAGVPVGRLRVWQELELNRFSDESTSSGGFVLTNFNGVVLSTGCSTATAVRLTF